MENPASCSVLQQCTRSIILKLLITHILLCLYDFNPAFSTMLKFPKKITLSEFSTNDDLSNRKNYFSAHAKHVQAEKEVYTVYYYHGLQTRSARGNQMFER